METVASPRIVSPGDRLGRYEIIAEIAQGGMASVYAVRLVSIAGFGKILAMKVLLPHLRRDREFVDMFLDEARIASSVQHPNVVQVFDLGEDDGTPYLVMELLRGKALSSVLKKAHASGDMLPLGAALAILARAAEGLHAAHETTDAEGSSLGIVHRDVSPQNVHVGYDGHVRVLDFGIAAAAGRLTQTRTGHIKGKFQYLAPEQVSRDRAVDRRSDVWALGVVAWELLSGLALFREHDDATTLWNVMNREVPPLRSVATYVPRAVAQAIDACLVRDPAARLGTCRELAAVLDATARDIGGGSTAELTQVMEHLFVAERAVEDERLAAALRPGPPKPMIVDVETDADGPTHALVVAPRRRAGLFLGASAVVAAAAAAALVWVAPYRGAGSAAPPAADGPSATNAQALDQDGPPSTAGAGAGAGTGTGAGPGPGAEAGAGAGAGASAGAGDGSGAPAGEDSTTTIAAGQPDVADARPVTIHIDPAVRLVLVDGTRRDDRPLRLALAPGASAAIEMVAPSGDIVRQSISGADDGTTLTLANAAAPPARERERPRGESRRRRPERSTPRAEPASNMSGDILRNVY